MARIEFTIPPIDKIKSVDAARQLAIDYQMYAGENSLAYGELVYYQNRFEEIAERWPELKEEFTENAII
jgi:hypothetical protein